MSDTEVAIGHLVGFEIGEGKKPISCFVGGVRMTIWKTVKDEDGDWVKNPLGAKFKEINESGSPVKVKYEVQKSKDGKFTNNLPVKVTTEDVDADEVTKGDKASEEAKSKQGQNRFGGKGSYTDEDWTAARWASAIILQGMGESVDLSKKATVDLLIKNATALGEASLKVRDALKAAKGKAAEAKPGENKAADAKPEEKENVAF